MCCQSHSNRNQTKVYSGGSTVSQSTNFFVTATVLSEVLFGVERLPDGRRKDKFRGDTEKLIAHHFTKRILPFDEKAARIFAVLIVNASRSGKAIQVSDGQIAATALAHNFSVATRDVAPFEAAGVKVINPWTV